MPKSENQKLKLLYMAQIFHDKSDADHQLTLQDIAAELEKNNIKCERKTLYADIKCLQDYGMEIEGHKKNRTYYYYLKERQFTTAELKLLVDSVQSSKYLTAKKSNELIKKLESLTCEYDRKQLQRQVHVDGRVKTDNIELYNSIDAIHQAIAEHNKIRFQYFQWNEKKQAVLRYNGQFYETNPMALNISKDRYYLITYNEVRKNFVHYRVDKMLNVSMMDVKQEVPAEIRDTKIAEYISSLTYMHSGEQEAVILECDNDRIGPIIDEYGKGISIYPISENRSKVRLKVTVSKTFIAWLFTLGEGVTVTGSQRALELIKKEASWIANKYLDEGEAAL